MKFAACLHRVAVDSEGESTVTLKIPLTNIDDVTALMKLTQTLLNVEISECEEREDEDTENV